MEIPTPSWIGTVIEGSASLLQEAKRAGLVDILARQIDRHELDEIHMTLQAMQNLAGSGSLASMKLMDSNGLLIDQVGSVVSIQSARLVLPDDEHVITSIVTPKPRQQKSMAIAWLGLEGSGKTSLIHRLKHGEYKEFSPTLGMNIEALNFHGHVIENMDIGNQDDETLREKWMAVLSREHQPDVISFTVDASDPRVLEQSKKYVQNIKHVPEFAGKPVMVIATKKDAQAPYTIKKVFDNLDVRGILKENVHISTIATSALQGTGIDEILFFLWSILDPGDIS